MRFPTGPGVTRRAIATAQVKAAELTGHAGSITALAVGFGEPPEVWSGGGDGAILELIQKCVTGGSWAGAGKRYQGWDLLNGNH